MKIIPNINYLYQCYFHNYETKQIYYYRLIPGLTLEFSSYKRKVLEDSRYFVEEYSNRKSLKGSWDYGPHLLDVLAIKLPISGKCISSDNYLKVIHNRGQRKRNV